MLCVLVKGMSSSEDEMGPGRGLGYRKPLNHDDDDDDEEEGGMATFQRRKRKKQFLMNSQQQSQDEDLYGIFKNGISDDEDDDDDYDEGQGILRPMLGKKHRGGEYVKKNHHSKKSTILFISSTQHHEEKHDPIPVIPTEATLMKESEIDPTEQQFHHLIGVTSNITGNKNNDFRNLVNSAAKQAEETASAAASAAATAKAKAPPPPPVPTSNLGQWEKHTKGFGKKMLEKMGFKGRLGARETGISAAVEVKVRPDAMGLGFGDFVESSMLENNKKLEAELLGKEYIPTTKENEKIVTKNMKNFAEKRAESKSWKLGGTILTEEELLGGVEKKIEKEKLKKNKRKNVSFDEMIGLGVDQEPEKQVIVDMRGPTTRFVLDPALLGLNDTQMSEKSSGGTTTPLLGQELLYNINLLVDMEQLEVDRLERKISSINTRVTSLESDLKELTKQLTISEETFNAFHAISEALNRIESTIQSQFVQRASTSTGNGSSTRVLSSTSSFDDDSKTTKALVSTSSSTTSSPAIDITFEMVVNAFVKLFTKYPKEVLMIGLIDIIPLLSEPILSNSLELWDITHDPMKLLDLYIQWTSYLSVFEISIDEEEHDSSSPTTSATTSSMTRINWKFIQKQAGFREIEPKAVVQNAYLELNHLIEKYSLPKLRRYLLNDWNVKAVTEVQNITRLLHGLQAIYQPQSFQELIDVTILPKLTAAVTSWSPTTDRTSLDSWILPWKNILGKPLSLLFPEIRRKIAKALTHWDPQDQSAYYVIKPWQDIFDKNSMENFLHRHIIPKLVSGMRMQSVEPQGQSTKYFQGVLLWSNLLSKQHILALLEGEFFPKWFQVLAYWLSSDDPDYSEISTWYTNWKSLIPNELANEEILKYYFNYALDMMSQALTSSTTPSSFSFTLPPTLSSADGTTSVNYFTIIEKYKLEERTMNRLQELKHGNTLSDLSTSSSSSFRYSSGTGTGSVPTAGTSRSSGSRPIDISFRDIVEEFATRNNVEFIQKLNPKTGETMHTMDGKVLWEFNHVVCYIDNNVLYVKRRRDEGSGGSGSGGSSGVGGGEWYPISFDDILELSKIIKK